MTFVQPNHVVRIVCDRPRLEVAGLLGGESTPESEGGRGGWTSTQRVRRSPIVEWQGPDVETYELALTLIAEATGDVDTARRNLERMSRMPAENVPPPRVRVEGLVPPADRVWAIVGWTSENTVRDADGRYVRLDVTVSLMLAEDTGDGVVVAKRVPAVYVARKGDTIAKLAVKFYGHARHAKALAAAQKPRVRDVRKALKVGRRVRLP